MVLSLKRTLNFKNGKLIMFLIVLAALIVLYNEDVSYNLASYVWNHLKASPRSQKILFVSDAQIVGLKNENKLFGYVTRWDCDNYLRKGFTRAYNHVKPDVIIFLGDLFDEGSVATDSEFQTYLTRFNDIFSTPTEVKRIYIPGDNDIGGEGYDPLVSWKVDRFQKYFPTFNDPVVVLDFIDVLRMSGYINRLDIANLSVSDIKAKSHNNIKLFISHLGVLDYYRYLRDEFLEIEPSVIISGHEHHSAYWSCYNCWKRSSREVTNPLDDPHVLVDDDLLEKTMLYQLVVPTCSYRMGVSRIGYGYMLVDESGLMQYTVLWMPGRYGQLYVYLAYLVFVVLVFVFRHLARKCFH